MRIKKSLYIIIITLLMTLSGPLQAVTASQLAEKDDNQETTTMRLPNEGRSDLQELIQRVSTEEKNQPTESQSKTDKQSKANNSDEAEALEMPKKETESTIEEKASSTVENDNNQQTVQTTKPAPRAVVETGTNGGCDWSYDNVTKTITFKKASSGNGQLATGAILETSNISVAIQSQFESIAFDGPVIAPVDSSGLFSGTLIKSIIGIANLDTSNVTNMSTMFSTSKVTSLDLSSWNVNKVTDFSSMFSHVSTTSLNLSNWGQNRNVTGVNMESMFEGAGNISNLTLNNFSTIHVVNMSNMFSMCYSLTSLNLSGWNIDEVETFTQMFYSASKLTDLNLSNWGTSRSVTNVRMGRMFYGTTKLTDLTLTNFNTANVTSMEEMFSSSGIVTLNLDDWNVDSVETFSAMFMNMPNLTNLNLSDWGTNRNETNVVMQSMFENTPKLTNLTLTNFNTFNVTSMQSMFNRSGVSSLDLSHWNVSTVRYFNQMFDGSSVESVNLSGWGTSGSANGARTISMFANTEKLISVNLSGFNMVNVTNISSMFSESAIETLDLSSWNTSNVTTATNAFANTNKLWKITLGENTKFLVNPNFTEAPVAGTIITDGDTTYTTNNATWQIVGNGTVHNPKGDVVTTTEMYADTPRPVTYVWAHTNLLSGFHGTSPWTFDADTGELVYGS
ncbi:BspA family leucine-rich repeat surface protein [Leuconostoc falkenbergense]|nr:BspA family leucine-rich repeat surface protein [Leuconostoc falkenbergense]